MRGGILVNQIRTAQVKQVLVSRLQVTTLKQNKKLRLSENQPNLNVDLDTDKIKVLRSDNTQCGQMEKKGMIIKKGVFLG